MTCNLYSPDTSRVECPHIQGIRAADVVALIYLFSHRISGGGVLNT